jgi:1-acyl-sn-glycerol-3-phosphate acyltransferase
VSWQAETSSPLKGYYYGARYRASWDTILRGIVYILRGKARSLAHDALYAIANMPAPPLIRGSDLIPEDGNFIVVANHYERPGLWMAWPALFVSRTIQERTGKDTHWIAIEEWESFSLMGIPIPSSVLRAVFGRAFQTYGIIAMPPMAASPGARAAAMRTATHKVRSGSIVGMMPEATVGQTPELLEAREGVGAFLLLLSSSGVRILPVGLHEEHGRLVAHFGEPFHLVPTQHVTKEERDAWTRRHVMLVIRDLLPEPLWGAFRSQ